MIQLTIIDIDVMVHANVWLVFIYSSGGNVDLVA